MSNQRSTKHQRSPSVGTGHLGQHDHVLIAIDQWLPGKEPTDYDIDLSDADEYRTRFWRCLCCGQERNRPTEFHDPCDGGALSTPLEDSDYSVEDPRTRRALTEEMDVRFGELGPVYEVHSQSGTAYETNVQAETCTCPDYQRREVVCKHLRRVELEIRAGTVPGPDGNVQPVNRQSGFPPIPTVRNTCGSVFAPEGCGASRRRPPRRGPCRREISTTRASMKRAGKRSARTPVRNVRTPS